MKPFRLWMLKATTAEQEALALNAGVSRGYLYQLADDRREATSKTAGRIAAEAELIRKNSKGRLPQITRADVSSVCGECSYALRCIRRAK